MAKFEYPPAEQIDVVDDYHGVKVTDPYRWLEDPDAPETQAWVEAENRLTSSFIQSIPARSEVRARLTELWNYPKYGVPFREGSRYFFFKNDGLQNQAVLYMQNSLDDEAVAILDPNRFSEDGTVALTNLAFSKDGTLMAYSVSMSGSDRQDIHIRNIDRGEDYPEVIRWCKFTSIAWQHDNAGFYYNRFPEPGSVAPEEEKNYNRVYWHQLNTAQSDDRLIFEDLEHKERQFAPEISEDGRYLLLYVSEGTDTKNRIYYREVGSDGAFIRLLDDGDANYVYINNDESVCYFKTDLTAPRGRIIAIDLKHPAREQWREIISEHEDVISFVTVVNDSFVIAYLHDAYHKIEIFSLQGEHQSALALPMIGSISGLSGKRKDREIFLGFVSFLLPESIYRYDFAGDKLTLFRAPEFKFDPAGYQIKQVFYQSKDGTRVPMFLVHKKALALDGNNPALLYGYGGFNISLTPAFSVSRLIWLEQGGVLAIANLRGGGEYGEAWHEAGMLARKQNVFDDFIAAAEWLIGHKYTRAAKLAIQGGSNGGLLVGACMLQRPELFGAVLCQVPVLDMLRYHKFTIGQYWACEYGNAETDAEQFKFLYAYSPLHNIKPGVAYPATLIVTADTDDRVVPAHAKKFAATLQAAQAGSSPILLRVEMKAGHGMGKPTAKVIEEQSDIIAFLFKTLNVGSKEAAQ